MLSAYHPLEDKLISHNEYLIYTAECDVQDRGEALRPRCPVCDNNMTTVAGKERADGHFRHEAKNSCPTKRTSAIPYENLRPSAIDLEAVESNKEFVKNNINNIWYKLNDLVPFLDVDEVIKILRKAKELNVYSYVNLDPKLIVYVYVNLINFLPSKSYKKQRALKFLFFYKSDNNENDLWINRGRPSKLFRISYDKQIPRKVVEFEPTIDYLNNNERQADQWLLEKLLREI